MLETFLTVGSSQRWDVTFLGEQPPEGFLTGTELASLLELTAGTAQHNDSGWLRFNVNEQDLYIAKKPFRYSISWNQINAVSAVYGTELLEHNGLFFKVRLLTGGNGDPASTPGGEWDYVLGRVLEGRNPGGYTLADLGMGAVNGRFSWVQETALTQTMRIYRGGTDFNGFANISPTSTTSTYGWRPVLEMIDPASLIWPITGINYRTDYVKAIRPQRWVYTD